MSSYVVLARKYRPRNFAEMVGQSHVVQALSNALTSQRLHHAYLFTGTRGVGKTTVSRILAKSLNCLGANGQGGITAEPCGVCQSCTDIDSGRFVDYTELDAASNRSVGEMQALLEQSVYKPVQGRFKVFMIDEVHMLSGHAFNAMLKTLEEPPEYLKFVLATTDPQKVPVTVLSRCLQFNLRPMAPQTVQEHLQHVLQAEGVSAEPNALRLIARAARGSMRDALSLTDQALGFGGGQLPEAVVRQMLGAVDRTYVLRLVDALAQGDGETVIEAIDSLRVNGLNAASTLEEMTTVLQSMAVLQAVPHRAGSHAALEDPDAVEIERLSKAMPADETQLLYSLCLHGRAELGLAPDEYAALTMVLLRLLAFKPSTGLAEKKTLKTRPETVSQQAASPSPPEVAAETSLTSATAMPVAPPKPEPETAASPPLVATPSALAVPAEPMSDRSTTHANSDEIPPWEALSSEPPQRLAAPTVEATTPRAMVAIPVREAGPSGRLD
ncbi:MAG: DNA polymerase III subunit gamma/tau, partial [Hydrogenophaga sp.]